MIGRIVLRYSVDLTRPNSFFLLPDGATIRAIIQDSSSETHTVEIALRYRKVKPGALHIRPITADLDTWIVESSVIHKDLARMEFQLSGVPWNVVAAFKEL